MSYATGRSPGADFILRNRPPSLRLIVPSVCFMEALSVFEGKRESHRRRLASLDNQLSEVKRNLTSSLVPSLVNHLDQARTETDFLFKDFSILLSQALEILGRDAELIHPTPEIFQASQGNTLIEDPTDNLILACILDHSKNHPSDTKVFLSENRKDFESNIKARMALGDSGIRYYADASKCWQWHRARSEI